MNTCSSFGHFRLETLVKDTRQFVRLCEVSYLESTLCFDKNLELKSEFEVIECSHVTKYLKASGLATPI